MKKLHSITFGFSTLLITALQFLLPLSPSFGGGILELAEPMDHWLYKLPNEQQKKIVTITVKVQQNRELKVQKPWVTGYCLPWNYFTRARTDENNSLAIKGPIGDWTFYAYSSNYLVQRSVKIVSDTNVVIGATRKMNLGLTDAVNRIVPEAVLKKSTNPIRLFFIPEELPGFIDPSSLGIIHSSSYDLLVTPGIRGRLWSIRDFSPGQPGLLYHQKFDTSSSQRIRVGNSRAGYLEIEFAGYGKEVRVVFTISTCDNRLDVARTDYVVPSNGGKAIYELAPGPYEVQVGIPGRENVEYVPEIVTIGAGSRFSLKYGNRFQVKPYVLSWGNKVFDLWFDISDNENNHLLQYGPKEEAVKLSQASQVFHDGPVGKRSRYIRLDRDWKPIWAKGADIRYEYRSFCGPVGNIQGTGSFPADQKIALNREGAPAILESGHFEVCLLNTSKERAAYLAGSLEAALSWLSSYYAGPVRPRGRQLWKFCSNAPVGVGWSGGNILSTHMYSGTSLEPYKPEGHAGVFYHEWGHCYQASDPHRHPKNMGTNTSESNATLIGAYCIRALIGEEGYRSLSRQYNTLFFDRLITGNSTAKPSPDDYNFIYDYIHNRYGQAVNRDFQRMLYRSEGNMLKALQSADFLTSEAERSSAVYSFLTGDNLAWLYRWVGENVTDEKIDKAVNYFSKNGVGLTEH